MYEDMNDLDRSRAAMRRRIEELNRRNANTAREISEILQEQIRLGNELMRIDVIKAVMDCFENLVRRTPVDTGRLRAGWQFTGDISDIEWKPPVTYDGYNDFLQDGGLDRAIQQSVRQSVMSDTDALYVFNNVEYLLYLNAGWSRHQAGNFIDLFLQELKGELQLAAQGRAA